ncbi:hypothetical protein QQ020_21745 [Fulvivirgaceae bacterium BMA12]|uniref:Uncharacterized protein n=1 Tax=Agaribacillus aureus TaxID=3051825 RepID=A0ABT8LAE7_9BACT|nr:hypothetical protein [Fulvivirgaceae bacterium BMA12]
MTSNGKKIQDYFAKGVRFKRITDDEFDQLIHEALQKVYPTALERLSLDEKDTIKKSVWISGPPDLDKLDGTELKIKKGKDKIIRFIPIGVTIYNFSPHAILAYQCSLDPVYENAMNECTHEFFYNDIVSFQTLTESGSATKLNWGEKVVNKIPLIGSFFSLGKKIQFDKKLQFILTTSGSSQLIVALADNVLKQEVDGGKFSLEKAKRSVDMVRRTIRDKKSHTFASLMK